MTLVGPNAGRYAAIVGADRPLSRLISLCVLSKPLAFRPEFSKMPVKPPVIRASGGRCDVTRCAPRAARGAACYPCGEAAEP